MSNNPYLDTSFLRELDLYNNKEVWVKITSLNFDELPIEEIQGKATGGSISVDGTSAVRRTCSITLTAENVTHFDENLLKRKNIVINEDYSSYYSSKTININDWYWSLNTKFKIQIGLTNDINDDYDDIIWFPMGVFLITSFSVTLNSNSYTINISGKDKMSLLNGDIGGNLTALSYDFGKRYEYTADNSNYTIVEIPLKEIVREAVHTFANEQYSNIIINGFDEPSLYLMEYRGDSDGYLLYNITDSDNNVYSVGTDDEGNTVKVQAFNFFTETENGEIPVVLYFDEDSARNESGTALTLEDLENGYIDFYNRFELDLTDDLEDKYTILYKKSNEIDETGEYLIKKYCISKISYGDTIGYKYTDLTYAGDLVGNVNETITSCCLDKIKTQMGEYEYFYNLDGQFVFQKKPTYVDTSFTSETTDGDGYTYVDNIADTTRYTYFFGDSNIISSFQNTPNLANIKNDYAVWGTKKGIDGSEISIHMRYAIDKKPEYYKNYEGTTIYISSKDKVLDSEYLNCRMRIITYKNWIHNGKKVYLYETTKEVYPDNNYIDHIIEIENRKLSSITTVEETNIVATTVELKTDEEFNSWKNKILRLIEIENQLMQQRLSNLNITICDWREIIYQMAIDYYNYSYKDDFIQKLCYNNKLYYPTGKTGYEQYYIDMEGFWRQLYDPDIKPITQVKDSQSIYYTWNGFNYNSVNFEDIVEIKSLDDNIAYYMGKGGQYWLLERPKSDTEIYYSKGKTLITSTNDSMKGKLYTRNDNGDYIYYQYINENNTVDENCLEFGKKYYYLSSSYKDDFETDFEYGDSIESNSTIDKYFILVADLTKYSTENMSISCYEIGSTPTYYEVYSKDKGTTGIKTCYSNMGEETTTPAHYILFSLERKQTIYIPETVQTILTDYGANSIDIEELVKIINGTSDKFQTNEVTEENFSEKQEEFKEAQILAISKTLNLTITEYNILKEKINSVKIVETLKYAKVASGDSFSDSKLYYTFNTEDNKYEPQYDLTADSFDESRSTTTYYYLKSGLFQELYKYNFTENYENVAIYEDNSYDLNTHWNYEISEDPQNLLFWFDFLDSEESDVGKYAVKKIGVRTKAEKNDKVKSIYYKETPNIIIFDNTLSTSQISSLKKTYAADGYDFYYSNNTSDYFSVSSQGLSAKDELDDLLYQYTYGAEQIQMTAMPVYYLQPNTRIFVYDNKSGINGEYIITKINYSLNYNGTMSITATKAVERLY